MNTHVQYRKHYRFNREKFIKSLVLTISVVMIIIMFLSFTGALISNANKLQRYDHYEVAYGDTLWTIAQSYPNDYDDIRYFIYQIKQASHLQGDSIFPGQQLRIPLK